jgi:hypothetical protein
VYNSRIPQVKAWTGPESLLFIGGADLELGQIYFLVTAREAAPTPSAYIWKWLHGRTWLYIGVLPAFS